MLDPALSAALFARASELLHTFLPEQLGSVLWALGSLGYSKRHGAVPAAAAVGTATATATASAAAAQSGRATTVHTPTQPPAQPLKPGSQLSTPQGQQRLQAVVSRMLPRLPVRGAAYCLWGLARMGFEWEDLRQPCCSLERGAPGECLASLLACLLACLLVYVNVRTHAGGQDQGQEQS